jgi:protease-4
MQAPKRKGWFHRFLTGLIGLVFVASLLLNFYLLALLAAQMGGPLRTQVVRDGDVSQVVAVYEVSGVIDEEVATSFATFCRKIRDDENVQAVVLRVETPGGGVAASDQMHSLVEGLKRDGKKVVISMGGLATSGGYYISAGADRIVAEPTTVTGSIGVIMMWPVIDGTLERLGVDVVVLKSENARYWKDELGWFSAPTDYQRQHLLDMLSSMQEQFESVVRAGRGERLNLREETITITGENGKPTDVTVTEPFNGKVYLTDEAMELGLIDQKGYLEDAHDAAIESAALTDPKVVRYVPRKGLLGEMLSARQGGGLTLDARSLDELQTPRILLMWKAE